MTNSGKTTLASKLKSTLQSDSMVQVINQDVYFRVGHLVFAYMPTSITSLSLSTYSRKMIRLTCGLTWCRHGNIKTGNDSSASIGTACAKTLLRRSLSRCPTTRKDSSFSTDTSFSTTGTHKSPCLVSSFQTHSIFARPIATICQEKFFIDLDKETILSRRIHRNYVPPDPEGYFDQWVWPMYLSNREALKEQSSISMATKLPFIDSQLIVPVSRFSSSTAYIDGSQSIEDMFDLVYRKLRSCQ